MDEKLLLLLLLLLSLHVRLWFASVHHDPTISLSGSYWFRLFVICTRRFPTSFSREFNWRLQGPWRYFPPLPLYLIQFVLHWRVHDDGGRRIRRSSGRFGFRAAKPASLMYLAVALPRGFPRRTRGQRCSSTGQHQGGTGGRACMQSGTGGRYARRGEASSRRPGTHRRDAPMPDWRGARCYRTAAQSQIFAAERVGKPVLRGSHYPRHWERPRKKTHAVTDIRLDGALCALFQG